MERWSGQIGEVCGDESVEVYSGLPEGYCEFCSRIYFSGGLFYYENFQLAGSPQPCFWEWKPESPPDARQVPSHGADPWPRHFMMRIFRPVQNHK